MKSIHVFVYVAARKWRKCARRFITWYMFDLKQSRIKKEREKIVEDEKEANREKSKKAKFVIGELHHHHSLYIPAL